MSSPYPLPLIQVDRREDTTRPDPRDSRRTLGEDMLKLLLAHRTAPQAVSATLTAGDFCFPGNGPNNIPVLVGVERKRLRDMINSMRKGRYSGEQLPKLFDHYEYIYLILEGRWKSDWKTGYLVHKPYARWEYLSYNSSSSSAPIHALELSSFLTDITTLTPVKLIRTEDERDTVNALVTLAHCWAKPWDKRESHVQAIHQPDQYITEKASTLRRVAFAIRGIGWERSRTVEEHFGSVEDMATASVERWGKLPGFGKVLSRQVWNQLHGVYQKEGEN